MIHVLLSTRRSEIFSDLILQVLSTTGQIILHLPFSVSDSIFPRDCIPKDKQYNISILSQSKRDRARKCMGTCEIENTC